MSFKRQFSAIILWFSPCLHTRQTCAEDWRFCMVVQFLADSRVMTPVPTQSGDFTLTAEKFQIHFLIPQPINTRSWPSQSSFPMLLSPSFHKPYSIFHSHFQLTAIFFLSVNSLLFFLIITLHHPAVTFLLATRKRPLKGQKIKMGT